MNLVVVTSVMRPIRDHTIYTSEQRFQQLLKTFESVRTYIPNCYIVMVEGSILTEKEEVTLKNLVDEFHKIKVTSYYKSVGEAKLLSEYLKILFAQGKKFNSFSKLSGRYHLNGNFYWDYPMDKIIMLHNKEVGIYETRYYRLPWTFLEKFQEGLEWYITDSRASQEMYIEQAFIRKIIDKELVWPVSVIGVQGFITWGKWVSE